MQLTYELSGIVEESYRFFVVEDATGDIYATAAIIQLSIVIVNY